MRLTNTLYLHGMGHAHPDHVIDNAFLESLNIGTNQDWILDRVGIRERRTALPLDYIRDTFNQDPRKAREHASITSEKTAALAAHMAMERAGLTPNDIGLVIAGGCSSPYSLPAHACLIAAELGIQSFAFDMNSACSTFAAHIHWVAQMQGDSVPDYVLLVQPEHWTHSVDYTDRKTAVLVGDASAAAIVSTRKTGPFQLMYSTVDSDPAGWNKVITPSGSHFCQDGSAVQRFAIKRTCALITEMRAKNALDTASHYFIGHQANLLMLQSVCRKMQISEAQHIFNIDRYGNCGAAGAPSVLSQQWDRWVAGDRVMLAVVGSGLSWGGLLIERQ